MRWLGFLLFSYLVMVARSNPMGGCREDKDCDDCNPCTSDECTLDRDAGFQCSHEPMKGCVTCFDDADCEDDDPCTNNKCTDNVCTMEHDPDCGKVIFEELASIKPSYGDYHTVAYDKRSGLLYAVSKGLPKLPPKEDLTHLCQTNQLPREICEDDRYWKANHPGAFGLGGQDQDSWANGKVLKPPTQREPNPNPNRPLQTRNGFWDWEKDLMFRNAWQNIDVQEYPKIPVPGKAWDSFGDFLGTKAGTSGDFLDVFDLNDIDDETGQPKLVKRVSPKYGYKFTDVATNGKYVVAISRRACIEDNTEFGCPHTTIPEIYERTPDSRQRNIPTVVKNREGCNFFQERLETEVPENWENGDVDNAFLEEYFHHVTTPQPFSPDNGCWYEPGRAEIYSAYDMDKPLSVQVVGNWPTDVKFSPDGKQAIVTAEGKSGPVLLPGTRCFEGPRYYEEIEHWEEIYGWCMPSNSYDSFSDDGIRGKKLGSIGSTFYYNSPSSTSYDPPSMRPWLTAVTMWFRYSISPPSGKWKLYVLPDDVRDVDADSFKDEYLCAESMWVSAGTANIRCKRPVKGSVAWMVFEDGYDVDRSAISGGYAFGYYPDNCEYSYEYVFRHTEFSTDFRNSISSSKIVASEEGSSTPERCADFCARASPFVTAFEYYTESSAYHCNCYEDLHLEPNIDDYTVHDYEQAIGFGLRSCDPETFGTNVQPFGMGIRGWGRMTWQQAADKCAAKGQTLCSRSQFCRVGPVATVNMGVDFYDTDTERIVAISDGPNEWMFVNSDDYCKLYTSEYPAPDWGIDPQMKGPEVGFRCCQNDLGSPPGGVHLFNLDPDQEGTRAGKAPVSFSWDFTDYDWGPRSEEKCLGSQELVKDALYLTNDYELQSVLSEHINQFRGTAALNKKRNHRAAAKHQKQNNKTSKQSAEDDTMVGTIWAGRQSGANDMPTASTVYSPIAEAITPTEASFSPDGKYAFVSLTKNNGIAVWRVGDCEIPKYLGIICLGSKNMMSPANRFDASDIDGVRLREAPVHALYQAEGLTVLPGEEEDTFLIVTANAGADNFYSMERVGDLYLDTNRFGDLRESLSHLDRLFVFSDIGQNGRQEMESLFIGGARSMSVWKIDAATLEGGPGVLVQEMDTGSEFERVLSESPAYNGGWWNDDFSTLHGPLPRRVTMGQLADTKLAFVAAQGGSAILVYNMNEPTQPVFLTRIDTAQTNAYGDILGGNIGPLDMEFINQEDSKTGCPMLIVTFPGEQFRPGTGSVVFYQWRMNGMECGEY
eukprot:TRINITY_DN30111_c0_g1_i1.p1 TRINITY_DN30111_c0_g1~~TRINITY_DN30111_c0_g1_i1.p1  ORF type:complete len:1270 (-),score=178.21 TRINITY_DN30111_c0_g1_i1:2393-6202(-)